MQPDQPTIRRVIPLLRHSRGPVSSALTQCAELGALTDPTRTIAVHRAELFVPARRVGSIRLPAIGMGLVQHDRDAQAAAALVEEDHLARRAHGARAVKRALTIDLDQTCPLRQRRRGEEDGPPAKARTQARTGRSAVRSAGRWTSSSATPAGC